ncbi:MAG: glycosyltransferase family 2 protein [Pseudomonadota bacterium]
MTSRTPVSAYIRTKNEARLIGEVVRAAQRAVDEVVIVDSGSTDETVAIAEAAGARIIHQEWLGNGSQKRVAEDACPSDWLFDLDADEIVSEELAKEIRALFANGTPAVTAFRTPMYFAPPRGAPWIGFGQQVRHKLYNKRHHRIPDHPVWDQFDVPPGAVIGTLKSPILHHAFRDTAHLVQKLNKNSSTRADNLRPKPYWILVVRILFAMPFYFAKRYFLDGFFRAGMDGFIFSSITAYGRWLRDVKMYEQHKSQSDNGDFSHIERSEDAPKAGGADR